MKFFPIYALVLATGAFAGPSQLDTRQQPFKSEAITSHNEPWAFAFLPDGKIFVTERRGNMRLVDPATKKQGTITGVPTVLYSGQGGLADVALHPKYSENSIVYISWAESGTGGGSGVSNSGHLFMYSPSLSISSHVLTPFTPHTSQRRRETLD